MDGWHSITTRTTSQDDSQKKERNRRKLKRKWQEERLTTTRKKAVKGHNHKSNHLKKERNQARRPKQHETSQSRSDRSEEETDKLNEEKVWGEKKRKTTNHLIHVSWIVLACWMQGFRHQRLDQCATGQVIRNFSLSPFVFALKEVSTSQMLFFVLCVCLCFVHLFSPLFVRCHHSSCLISLSSRRTEREQMEKFWAQCPYRCFLNCLLTFLELFSLSCESVYCSLLLLLHVNCFIVLRNCHSNTERDGSLVLIRYVKNMAFGAENRSLLLPFSIRDAMLCRSPPIYSFSSTMAYRTVPLFDLLAFSVLYDLHHSACTFFVLFSEDSGLLFLLLAGHLPRMHLYSLVCFLPCLHWLISQCTPSLLSPFLSSTPFLYVVPSHASISAAALDFDKSLRRWPNSAQTVAHSHCVHCQYLAQKKEKEKKEKEKKGKKNEERFKTTAKKREVCKQHDNVEELEERRQAGPFSMCVLAELWRTKTRAKVNVAFQETPRKTFVHHAFETFWTVVDGWTWTKETENPF